MSKSFLFAAALLVPFTAVACAASQADGTQGDDQNVKASQLGEAGALCGGIAGLRCKTGLKCTLSASFPDASGTCGSDAVRPGEAGGMCGGIAGIGCKAGLRCDMTGKGIDASGTCAIDDNKPTGLQCQAVPACLPSEQAVDSCSLKDVTCSTSSLCGKTIHCQKTGELTFEGTLRTSVGIGGENTGFSIDTSLGLLELVLDKSENAAFVGGRFARAKGKTTTLTGIETKARTALAVSSLLVCPSSGTSVNCQPPVSADNTLCGGDRAWIQKNCSGVSFLD